MASALPLKPSQRRYNVSFPKYTVREILFVYFEHSLMLSSFQLGVFSLGRNVDDHTQSVDNVI